MEKTKRKKQKNGLMKYEVGRKIMTEFSTLRPVTYSYLTDDNYKTKNQKAQKSVS